MRGAGLEKEALQPTPILYRWSCEQGEEFLRLEAQLHLYVFLISAIPNHTELRQYRRRPFELRSTKKRGRTLMYVTYVF